MKKLLYLVFVLLFLFSCKGKENGIDIMSAESARDIYLSYLSVKKDVLLSSSFSECQLEYKKHNHVDAYTCQVQAEGQKTYIFVISNDKKLKSEVNPAKQDIKELVYIAHLNYDKSLNKVAGEKLLFSIDDKMIIDNQEIKQHF